MSWRALLWGASALAVLSASSALAQQEVPAYPEETLRRLESAVTTQSARIADQERRIADQEQALAAQAQALAEQQQTTRRQRLELEDLRSRLAGFQVSPALLPAVARVRPPLFLDRRGYRDGPIEEAQERTPRAPRAPSATQPADEEQVTAEEVRPESERPVDERLLETGAVLLPRGTLQIEPTVSYSHTSSDRVAISGFTIFEAIVIGEIRVDRLDRDIVNYDLAARLGLTDRVQVEARLPTVYRNDREVLAFGTAQQQERTVTGFDIGDVEATISYQAVLQRGAVPGVIARVRGRFPTGESPFEIPTVTVAAGTTRLSETPTGSGFYSVAPGATLVWRTDPVAFFMGGSYNFALKRDQGPGFGTIDPGDTVEFFSGLNFALSERVGLSFSFLDQFTDKTTQNGIESPGTFSNDARLNLGTSIGLAPGISLLASTGIGLTEQSPDFTFSLSLPISLDLF